VGDTVRGVYVGLEGTDPELSRAGPLERVSITWVSVSDLLGGRDQEREASPELSSDAVVGDLDGEIQGKKGLWVEVSYENVVYEALLLPALDDDAEEDEEDQSWGKGRTSSKGDEVFLKLPLLLTRMNGELRTVFLDFLSTEFDCRASPLRLGTKSLVRIWERWIRDVKLEIRMGGKDLAITLGFYDPPAPEDQDELQNDPDSNADQPLGLRTVDIILTHTDVQNFVTLGRNFKSIATANHWSGLDRERRFLSGNNDEEGWAWREPKEQPFMEALARYLDGHMGMDLFHPSVRITKVACGGFVLTEGRVKVFDGEKRGVKNLLGDLARRGRGDSIRKVF